MYAKWPALAKVCAVRVFLAHQWCGLFRPQTKESGKLLEKPVTKTDSGTQTDTHFHESNIVASYEWNEWELRRKALKLVSRN